MRLYMAEIASDFQFAKLHPDHLDVIYNLYAENNSFYDEFLDRKILSANRDYCYEDFLEILQDDKVFGFVLTERIPFQEHNKNANYYSSDIIYTPIIRGFLVYEITGNPQYYNILFIESEFNNVDYSIKLINNLKNKLIDSKKSTAIKIEVFDTDIGYKKIPTLIHSKFSKIETLSSQKGPDVFIYEILKSDLDISPPAP